MTGVQTCALPISGWQVGQVHTLGQVRMIGQVRTIGQLVCSSCKYAISQGSAVSSASGIKLIEHVACSYHKRSAYLFVIEIFVSSFKLVLDFEI